MIHDISAKNLKNFFKWKKIQLEISKSGVFLDQQKRGLVVLGGRRLRRKEGVIAGGQRSEIKPRIFNTPFPFSCYVISLCDHGW